MYENENSPLSSKSDAFSCRIVKMVKYLYNNKDFGLRSIYDQVLRSGTSISANVGESQFAQSTADFITKLHIALKEANETRKWLLMLRDSECITTIQYDSMNKDLNEIIAILVASLNTAKRNQQLIVK